MNELDKLRESTKDDPTVLRIKSLNPLYLDAILSELENATDLLFRFVNCNFSDPNEFDDLYKDVELFLDTKSDD